MATNTKKPPTKSEIYAKIVDDTGLTRKDVAAVFESLNGQIKKNLGGRGGPGVFTIPGLLKLRVVKKPAKKARKGVNPFTGEEMIALFDLHGVNRAAATFDTERLEITGVRDAINSKIRRGIIVDESVTVLTLKNAA